MVILLIAVFLFGITVGVVGLGVYALYRLRKFDQERLKFTQNLIKNTKKLSAEANSAKDRINKAFDICERQFAILSGLEGPQSGPLHGKHKQKMNAEIKRLEEEKMTILKSVLADGFDPKLVTINEAGERESIKLSEFIKKREMMEQQKPMRQASETPPPRKLSLIKTTEQEDLPK